MSGWRDKNANKYPSIDIGEEITAFRLTRKGDLKKIGDGVVTSVENGAPTFTIDGKEYTGGVDVLWRRKQKEARKPLFEKAPKEFGRWW